MVGLTGTPVHRSRDGKGQPSARQSSVSTSKCSSDVLVPRADSLLHSTRTDPAAEEERSFLLSLALPRRTTLATLSRRRPFLLLLLTFALSFGVYIANSYSAQEALLKAREDSIAYFAGLTRTSTSWQDEEATPRVRQDTEDGESNWVGGIEPNLTEGGWQKGGDGDLVTLSNGSTFLYRNPFGGTFDADPFSYKARPQAFAKSLEEEWDWEVDRIRGVNLGGWLSLEPFIAPSLFEPYLAHGPDPARDEWSLSELARADESLGPDSSEGAERLERYLRRHYEEFITEQDFAEIAAAGLNWIRLPFSFWAIETWEGEPFLEGVAWEYVLKAIEWARKYGLRINLDLHAVPGSQNGWNHSGKLGPINFLQSAMGLANAQRTLDYLSSLAEFCTRDGVRQVVGMLSLVNEVPVMEVGERAVKSFYAEAYERIRNMTGYGAGNGPVIAIHDGFKGTRRYAHFLETQHTFQINVKANAANGRDKHKVVTKTRYTAGLDRVALDSHRYLAFLAPEGVKGVEDQMMQPCLKWAADFNRTFSMFGIPVSGEFSLAINDCGRFLNNVGEGNRLEGTFPNASHSQFPPSAPEGTCEYWERYDLWDDQMKSSLRDFARAQMDTFQNWFYWTWKTGKSTLHFPDLEANPLWSYSLGLREGWIPQDPRDAVGFCFSRPRGEDVPQPKRYPLRAVDPWKIGKAGYTAGPIPAELRERYQATWPPVEFNPPHGGLAGSGGPRSAGLPVYERQSGNATPLRGPIGSKKVQGRLDWVRPIEGCEYPDIWAGEQEYHGDSSCTAAGRGVA
ncbi:hypothetical protein JCM10908_003576 [Rhodotorula pacifica]|uniref:uncharacterized protein n=1 Tax=Rhodotorula pacifica TaxID=1495444 RepID=UPI00316D257E